jgi:hypothetical protein
LPNRLKINKPFYFKQIGAHRIAVSSPPVLHYLMLRQKILRYQFLRNTARGAGMLGALPEKDFL